MSKKPVVSPSSAHASPAHKKKFAFDILGRTIFPVETSAYKTIDFSKPENADVILYSTRLTACAMIVIKNFNPETGKYDNVVTMAHFLPNNLAIADIDNSLKKIFEDFIRNGGTFNDKTSIQLFGGGIEKEGDKSEFREKIKERLAKAEMKFKEFNDTLNLKTREYVTSCEIFIDKNGTQIMQVKSGPTGQKLEVKFLTTKPSESIPQEFMQKAGYELERVPNYNRFTMQRSLFSIFKKDSFQNTDEIAKEFDGFSLGRN